MSHKFTWVVVGAVILTAVIAQATVGQSGIFLRTTLLNDSLTEVAVEVVDDSVSPDDQARLEVICQQAKESHITHCGEMSPEEDYACRTTHAEQAYQECLTTTKLEDIPVADESFSSEAY